MSDYENGDEELPVNPYQTTSDKVRKLLQYAYDQLSPADKVRAALRPGIVCHTGMESAEFILEATGEIIAIADRAWLADDTDQSFHPEWVPGEQNWDLPEHLRD